MAIEHEQRRAPHAAVSENSPPSLEETRKLPEELTQWLQHVQSWFNDANASTATAVQILAKKLILALSSVNKNRGDKNEGREIREIAATCLPLLQEIRSNLKAQGARLDPYIDNLRRRVEGQQCASLEEVEENAGVRQALVDKLQDRRRFVKGLLTKAAGVAGAGALLYYGAEVRPRQRKQRKEREYWEGEWQEFLKKTPEEKLRNTEDLLEVVRQGARPDQREEQVKEARRLRDEVNTSSTPEEYKRAIEKWFAFYVKYL